MRRLILVACLLSFVVGCDGGAKPADPKPADPSKIDPRLKQATSGSGGAPKLAPPPKESTTLKE
jgi:hypothetical protein